MEIKKKKKKSCVENVYYLAEEVPVDGKDFVAVLSVLPCRVLAR